ncbi:MULTISPECIES: type I-U CRISPR-associated RAMP protein Csb1/Cas7u [Limnochorda]|uniref:type I-G CRISPR-associated RAMP protein Csb1/Cas7g n=1 Tax=Limnochorda TaxID=1676651 RepID=UPI001E09187E|nr:type I-U CRISPR-associated RAMP protein Csb1/Cas7u [Limnochorda pilosa]MBO2487341.1 type I-U CRISPR-associated protein Cas7 [Bacillota bacterium]MBO2519877.1 type I-U CRISPR-associated protein Cas7 [Bacillota bacterium]
MAYGWIEALRGLPRMLIEADLKPVQGDRFQPTGFPDLGAATYRLPDGTEMLLVESAQSVANRLEAVCWDEAAQDLAEPLRGLPYGRARLVKADEEFGFTTTLHEAHRLNSPYFMLASQGDLLDRVQEESGLQGGKRQRQRSGAQDEDASAAVLHFDLARLARTLFKYDPNSLLHGVFLEKLDGRARLQRTLSGFIEAREVAPATSGGVKNDRISPSGDTSLGYGNVPFSRTEYVAQQITAYFNLDLAQLRAYRLPDPGFDLLVTLALWKIRVFLEEGLRLRTACDLQCREVRVTKPEGASLPDRAALEEALPQLIEACRPHFADPPVSEVVWSEKAKKGS